jgi:hypothetical protein
MTHTIDNTLTADELDKELPLVAEMPGYMNIRHTYDNLKQAGKAALAVVGVSALAYAGNKAREYFNNNTNNVPVVDPNNDISWEYKDK